MEQITEGPVIMAPYLIYLLLFSILIIYFILSIDRNLYAKGQNIEK